MPCQASKSYVKKRRGDRPKNYLKKRLGNGFFIWYFGGAVETKPLFKMNKLKKLLQPRANTQLAETMQKHDNTLYSEDYFREKDIECPWASNIIQRVSTDTFHNRTRKELWALDQNYYPSHKLGTMSAGYQPIHNTQFLGMLRAAMAQNDLQPTTTNIWSTLSGTRCRIQMYIENHNIAELKETGAYHPKVGDELGILLTADNSYDSTWRPRLSSAFNRVWCDNGCASFSPFESELHKHTDGIDIKVFRNELNGILESIKKDAYIIQKLKEIKIDQRQGQRFVEKLIADVLKLNQVDSTAMRLHWQRPDTGILEEFKGLKLDGEAGNDRNAWQVFNTATRVLSDKKTNKSVEAKESTSARLSSVFAGFANDPETIAEWTTFEPFKREKVDGKITKVPNESWRENWQNSVLNTVVA